MKLKKTKYLLFTSGIYALVCLVLLVTLTTSKYADEITAYTGFGIAEFNAMIVDPEMPEGSAETLVTTLSTDRFFKPGMVFDADAEKDTSAHIDFAVANGFDGAYSDVSMNYTVAIRTDNILPLEYKLAATDADGNWLYYDNDGYTVITGEAGAPSRYEYRFKLSEYNDEEPVFTLHSVFDTNGQSQRVSQRHKLHIYWPADTEKDTNDAKYMKEIEILEIIVTTTSLNQLDVPGYGDTGITGNDEYSSGLILLVPPEERDASGDYGNEYRYNIDLRSFRVDSTNSGTGVFVFHIDNAVSFQVAQDKSQIKYTGELKVPADLLYEREIVGDKPGNYTQNPKYSFRLYHQEDKLKANGLSLKEYRLYDEKTDTYKDTDVFGTLAAVAEAYPSGYEEPLYKLYAIYELSFDEDLMTLRNLAVSATGANEKAPDRHQYEMEIHGTDLTADSFKTIFNDLSFKNKVELKITATFTNGTAAGGTENGGAEGTETPAP